MAIIDKDKSYYYADGAFRTFASIISQLEDDALTFMPITLYARTNVPTYLTVYYTKTTDAENSFTLDMLFDSTSVSSEDPTESEIEGVFA